jgi:hydrogenase maturation protease
VDCEDRVLVIAWGNPLREDDAAAWHVLERLRSLQPRPGLPALYLRHAHQLAPEFAECVSRARGVVFVDARHDGEPGEVRCDALEPRESSDPLGHFLSPETLLLYARQLYGRAPRAVLVSITGERFGIGEGVSAPVRRAVPRAVREIVRLARDWATLADEPPRPEAGTASGDDAVEAVNTPQSSSTTSRRP